MVDSPPSVLQGRAQGEPLARYPEPARGRERRWLRFYRGRATSLAASPGSWSSGLARRASPRPKGISYLITETAPSRRRAPKVETISTIGSGDAYLAGLLAGLLHRNLAPAEAVRLAAGCAAANAETLGAGLFEARRAEELADSVQIESPLAQPSRRAGPRAVRVRAVREASALRTART